MHYKNGREAKVGDPVVGTCFNTKDANDQQRVVSGTLVSVTPGNDSCSAMVGFVEVREPVAGNMAYDTVCKVQGDSAHGSAGRLVAVVYKQDYTECKYLLHADDIGIKA